MRAVKHVELHRIGNTELRVVSDVDMGETAIVQAEEAVILIETSKNLGSICKSSKVLHPPDYTVRAEAMVRARRLVGGVEIEVVQDMKKDSGKK